MRRNRLPPVSAPLVLSDGTEVAPTTVQTFQRIEVPTATQAQRIVSSTRRKLIDMPALPKHMNSYAVVLAYTASGLSDAEIGAATGFDEHQIEVLRNQPAYRQLETMVVEAVKSEAASAVKDVLVNAEMSAAKRMASLVESDDDRTALSAAREVLHMGGHKAAEKVDIRSTMMNTFRIEVVDKRDSNAPVIDMEVDSGDSTQPS